MGAMSLKLDSLDLDLEKARAIRDGLGAWDDRIITEMKIAVGFEMSVADNQFLENYVAWRRRNPL